MKLQIGLAVIVAAMACTPAEAALCAASSTVADLQAAGSCTTSIFNSNYVFTYSNFQFTSSGGASLSDIQVLILGLHTTLRTGTLKTPVGGSFSSAFTFSYTIACDACTMGSAAGSGFVDVSPSALGLYSWNLGGSSSGPTQFSHEVFLPQSASINMVGEYLGGLSAATGVSLNMSVGNVIPEPASIALLGTGSLLIGLTARRRAAKRSALR